MPQTLNLEHSTINPKPQTPNSKPHTPHPKPQTPNPKLQTATPAPYQGKLPASWEADVKGHVAKGADLNRMHALHRAVMV